MAVTIKDVAALAGVSSSTVSRTCKNNPSISEETKEKVRRAMAQLGYEPNFQASNPGFPEFPYHRDHSACFRQRGIRKLLLSGSHPRDQPAVQQAAVYQHRDHR